MSRISQNHDSPPYELLIKSSVNKCKYSLKTPSKDIDAVRPSLDECGRTLQLHDAASSTTASNEDVSQREHSLTTEPVLEMCRITGTFVLESLSLRVRVSIRVIRNYTIKIRLPRRRNREITYLSSRQIT